MIANTLCGRDARCGIELSGMPLPVRYRQRVTLVAEMPCNRQHGSGIQAPRQEHHCGLRQDSSIHFPATLPHRYLCSCTWKRTGR